MIALTAEFPAATSTIRICRALVKFANDSGGRDNITAAMFVPTAYQRQNLVEPCSAEKIYRSRLNGNEPAVQIACAGVEAPICRPSNPRRALCNYVRTLAISSRSNACAIPRGCRLSDKIKICR
jgi:hypothetical protein